MLFVWQRCQGTLTSLVLNKGEGQPRRINLITFIVCESEEVLNTWYCGSRVSVLPVKGRVEEGKEEKEIVLFICDWGRSIM